MQLAFYPLLKLAVFSVMANTVAAVSLPEPVGLEACQTTSQCLLNLCNPGAATVGCCANSTCSGVSLLGLSIGLCTPSSCNVICSKTSDCCTNVPGTTFSCELLLGQSIGFDVTAGLHPSNPLRTSIKLDVLASIGNLDC